MEAMILPLKRYAQFNGRSRRKEFWLWILFVVVTGVGLSLLDAVLGLGGYAVGGRTPAATPGYGGVLSGGLLANIFALAVVLPNVTVSVRRLHDTNRSGWWMLLPLAPLLGIILVFLGSRALGALLVYYVPLMTLICAIVVFVWYCTGGTAGPNRFGDDPKADSPADLARTFE